MNCIGTAPVQKHDEGQFNPYVDNGGTVCAIAGKGFAVAAGDSRMSNGYGIHTRNYVKTIKLTDKCVLCTSGMQADTAALQKLLLTSLEQYEFLHGKTMSTPAIAQFLSTRLYYRRFFPYYTFNLLVGLDDDNIGGVYTYDAIGSYERVKYSSQGTGQKLVQPFLDNQVGLKHRNPELMTSDVDDLDAERAQILLRDALTSAGERDINTGDYIDDYTITSEGISHHREPLKFD